jgi:hypothetical protein
VQAMSEQKAREALASLRAIERVNDIRTLET